MPSLSELKERYHIFYQEYAKLPVNEKAGKLKELLDTQDQIKSIDEVLRSDVVGAYKKNKIKPHG